MMYPSYEKKMDSTLVKVVLWNSAGGLFEPRLASTRESSWEEFTAECGADENPREKRECR
jgi:hypothetical protein